MAPDTGAASTNDERRRRPFRIVTDLLRPGAGQGLGAQLANQSAQTTFLNLGAVVLSFLTSILLTRLLGARGYGVYVYVLAWPALLAVAAQLGYGHMLVRNIAAYSARQEWGLVRGIVRRSQRVVLGASAVLAAAAGVTGWLFVGHGQPLLRQSFFIALLLVPTGALIAQREAVLRGFQRVVLGRLAETLIQPTLLLVLVGVLYVALRDRLTPPYVVAATVAAAAGGVAAGTLFVSRVTPSHVRVAIARADRAAWSRSARSLFAINGLQVVNLQMSVLLLGALKSVDATALFSVALRLSGTVSFLQTAVVFPLAPALARLHASGAHARLQRLVSKANLGVLICSTPVVMGLLVFGEQALSIFGDQFRTGQTALTILVIGEIVNVASGFVGIILINTGNERTMFAAVAWLTGLKVVVSAVLINSFGLEGAAIGQALGLAAQNVVLAVVIWRRLGIYSPGIGSKRFARAAVSSQVER